MFDDVRLIIWDLDETLWKGTLTEGGIREHISEHYDLIRTLNQRGIMNSICSKNDFEPTKAVLKAQGVWDQFVFPSISWAPKGPRISNIVASIQLRPETVLFIDDNPSNLAEAQAHVPALKVADETAITELLLTGHLLGKDDTNLTRLQQYKLLELKQLERSNFEDDNNCFLRNSDIVVSFEYDIEKHVDRAVELVNRTNQLNFTKNRLPDDPSEAAALITAKLRNWYCQAALVRAKDKYGDYGFIGLYVLNNIHGESALEHFCFSCRTLGMGIEKFVYDKLGRPKLTVVGDVIADIFNDSESEWIAAETSLDLKSLTKNCLFREIRLRGGCDLDALLHYLSNDADRSSSETNYIKMPHFLRRDTSTNLVHSLSGNVAENVAALQSIGLDPKEVTTEFFGPCEPGTLLILSAWADIYAPIYRNRTSGFEYSISLYNLFFQSLHDISHETLNIILDSWNYESGLQSLFRSAHSKIVNEYEALGLIDEARARKNWKMIIDKIPTNAVLCILLPNKFDRDESSLQRLNMFNNIISEIARGKNNVFCVDISDSVGAGDNIQDNFPDHVHRMVYYRTYLAIKTVWQERLSAEQHRRASAS